MRMIESQTVISWFSARRKEGGIDEIEDCVCLRFVRNGPRRLDHRGKTPTCVIVKNGQKTVFVGRLEIVKALKTLP